MEELAVTTHARCELLELDDRLREFLARHAEKGWTDGFLCVYSPHTTCAVTINEGYDPDVRRDITAFLGKLIPQDWGFRHIEGNSDAHIKTALLGAHCLVPVQGGRLALGRWQTVYLCEFDGPRRRSLRLSFLKAE